MGRHDMYPLHTGFLTKSPPERKVTGNFKRWMKRWFILWEDKTLEYYQDRGDLKPKKTIDLSRCDFLDSNLSAKRFENIFSIRIRGTDKTSARTYYLAAETSYEMNEWVDQICKLCEFKASENNNNADATVRHKLAPLDKNVTPVVRKERDSGIIVPENDPGDLVQVRVVTPSAYDEVPPPRPIKNESQSAYDYPPQHREIMSPRKSPVGYSNSCPLDVSSSSESSLSSFNKRSSCESEHSDTDNFRSPENIGASSDMRRCSGDNYDYPPVQPYDVPPNIQQQPYDLSPQKHYPQENYDVPPLRNILSNQQQYDVPPSKQQQYDLPPPRQDYPEQNYDVPPKSGNDDFQSEEEKEIYDVPPQPTYDTVPAPVMATRSNTMSLRKSITRVPGMVQQFPTRPAQQYDPLSPNVPPGLQYTDYNLLPSNTESSIYDKVPLRFQEQPTYDPVSQGLPSGDTSSNYDAVPAPVRVPVIPRHTKPPLKPYVNLSFPIDQGYKKPLPNPPQQRDSGTGFDDEAVYDVPPVQLGQPVPSVDRTNKPGTSVAPKVDRCLKPNKTRDYVNLDPKEMRRATVKEGHSTRTGGNVQRSKSAAADFETEGYLYMESPKRTESSLRYIKKDRKSLNEENENQEEGYMYMERNGHDMSYQNYDVPSQYANERKPPSPERAPLRGHYQDIDVVCQREGPCVPERSPRTQYTTIDVEKTMGFRKTCEDVGKNQ